MAMSDKQNARQDKQYRNNGKYAVVNQCYRCGKGAGVDYFSDERSDKKVLDRWIGDEALCLCQKCADFMAKLTDAEFLVEIDRENYGKLPQGKAV